MGAWGPAIFSDDTACDVRGEYRELLEDGLEDDEATRQVVAAYAHLDADESHVLWLALGAAQVALGRLEDHVKAEALRIIDNEIGLDVWVEAGPQELAKRRAALNKLRDGLTGPQKTPSRVRKPWSHVTDLEPGDLLAYRLPDSGYGLFRVARRDEQRAGTAPILRRLNWSKASLPSARKASRLKPLPETNPLGSKPSVSCRVARHRKKDEDWQDVGFVRVGRTNPSHEDLEFAASTYTTWRALARSLDQGWPT